MEVWTLFLFADGALNSTYYLPVLLVNTRAIRLLLGVPAGQAFGIKLQHQTVVVVSCPHLP